MRRFVIFLLVFTLIFSSVTSLAAPEDIIHTGLKKIYRAGDTNDLINDIVNNADNTGFLDKFYREVEGGKYVNVQEEEKAQLAVLEALILANGLNTPEKLQDYITKNGPEIASAIANIVVDQKTIDVGDYKGNSNASLLKTPTNYSMPVPGSADNTTKIVKLTKPTGLGTTRWVYKIGDKPFAPIQTNEILSDGINYSAGTDIPIIAGKYLLICIVDNSNKVKAYASIDITADMVKAPRVVVLPTDIAASFSESTKKSGATVVSGLPIGAWKIAALDTSINIVYEDSKFAGSMDYVAGMDIVLANDAELDSMPADFNKSIIIYSEENGKIEKYKVFTVGDDDISGALDAKKTITFTPGKGSVSGSTKIVDLKLPTGATKWMYAFVENTLVVPKLDRVYTGSVGYTVEQDIPVKTGDKYLMILATDDDGKVQAYGIVELEDGMIKDPLAMLLNPGTHYKDISKGNRIGETKITVSTSPLLNELFSIPANINWMYIVSKTPIAIPEMNSKVVNGKSFSSGMPFKVAEEVELRGEDPFKRYLMILATEVIGQDAKIKGYAMIDLNRSQVKYPDAKLLGENINYSNPIKGNMAGTTRIASVDITNLDNHYAWWYKVVKGTTPPAIEFKETITRTNGFNIFATTQNIAINPNEYIVLVSVDKDNKAIAYANILVDATKITASTAISLKPSQNYEGPVPGSAPNSTRFVKLLPGGLTGDIKWMYKFGKTSFGNIETGALADTANGYKEYIGEDIKEVFPNDRLLLVAVGSDYKVMAATEITLTPTMIRGKDGYVMENDNYTVEKGSAPSTTKLTNLNLSGIDGHPYSGWKWMYKVLDSKLTGSALPYIDQKVDGVVNYIEGKDIVVNHSEEKDAEYGYILLLATDSTGMTKAYAQIPISKDNVRESAPQMAGVSLKAGSKIDRTSFDVLSAGKYLYKIDIKAFARPAVGDTVVGGTAYIVGDTTGFSVKIGSHIILYKVDGDNKVLEYDVFVVGGNDVAKGNVTLDEKTLLEGNIVNGGEIITFTLLGDDKWNDIKNDKVIRDKLFMGLKANNQSAEWSKVVSGLIAGGSGYVFIDPVDNKKISIRLPNINDYNIVDDQVIQFAIPPEAIDGAVNPLVATGKLNIKPTIKATVSGTVVSQIVRENDIESGGATIVITLTDASWGLDLSTILDSSYVDGITDQDTTNWHKIKAAIKANPLSIVANSDKMVTITIPKGIDVNFGVTKEIISLKIPKGLIQGATEDVVATPNFTLYPNVVKVEFDTIKSIVRMEAPDSKVPLKDNDIWEIKLTNNKFKKTITDKDISIVGLPAGLKPTVTRKSDLEFEIKLTGVATSFVDTTTPRLRIKATAVEDLNSVDSDEVILTLEKGQSMDLDSIKYEIKSDGIEKGIYLSMPDAFEFKKIKYSINSKNGIDGTWDTVGSINPYISTLTGPIKIYVHEIAQPKVFKEVGNLINSSAPVVSVKTISYDEKTYLQNLTLDSTETDLEYNKGDVTWHDLVNGTVENLDSKSILIVRKKAKFGIGKDSYLPSLPTPKLNGLFLGGVSLDVSQSKIMGATKDMKYRLSDNGTWNLITVNDPIVDFKEGNKVFISEAKNENNARPLGTISQTTMSVDETTMVKKLLANETDSNGIYYHVGNKKIINKTGIKLQYNITKGEVPTGNWINLDDTAENVNFVVGNVFVRKIVDSNSLPSNPVKIIEISDAVNPPKIEVNQDNKTLLYESASGYKLLDKDFEYRINTGDYLDGDLLATDPKRLGNVTVYVKKKSTQKLLASKEISFTFTENISLANVKVNVAKGVIEGTTAKMEYRTDENSPWKLASSTETPINMYEGMSIWIRELGKPSTKKLLLEDLGKMAETDKTSLEYNIAQKFIKNNFTNILEYRINDGGWNAINVGQTISIEFAPTRLSIRAKATFDKLASDVVNVIENLAYPDLAPVVVPDDIGNKVSSIDEVDYTGWGIYEFKLKTDSEWMPASLLDNYDLSGDKIVHIRKKGTPTTLPSEIAEIIFTKNIDLTKVGLRKTTPLTLIATEPEMEYQVYLKDKPIPTIWTKASAGTTTLDSTIKFDDIKLIVIRDSRNKDILRILVGTENDLPVDLSVVSYKITDSEIIFTGITARMRYKLSSSTLWKVGNGFDVGTGNLELMEISLVDTEYPTNTRTIAVSKRAETPVVIVGKVDYDNSQITLDGFDKDKMEYSVDGGESWDPLGLNPIKITKDNILVVRAKAIPGKEGVGKLPSLPTTQLNGTSLVNVKVDIQNKKLLNTTISMEYSLDSTDGKNGTWKPSNDKETGIQLELGMKIYIREIKNTANIRMIGPIGQELIPDLTGGVSFDISAGKIANSTDQDLEYRVSGGSWNPINEVLDDSKVAYNVDFKPGPLEFRRAANGSNSASKPATLTVIKVPGSKPQMAYNDIEDKVELPAAESWKDYEYRITIDGISSQWTSGEELEKEDLSGKKKVEIRKKATPKDLPSEYQEITFTDNLIKRVGLSTHVKPFELNGTTKEMEYNIYLADGRNTGWTLCSDVNTSMPDWLATSIAEGNVIKIEVREKDKTKNTVIVYQK